MGNIEVDQQVPDETVDAVDLLLENRPDDVRANVYRYLSKHHIDPNDELFILFTALGQLEFFLENSPKEIQNLFLGFNKEISQWSTANLETLKHLSEKATITEKLAISSETLGQSLKEFLKVCNMLIEQLQNSNSLQTSSLSQLQTSEIELQTLMSRIEKKIGQFNSNVSELSLNVEDWTDPMSQLNQSANKIDKKISQLATEMKSHQPTWTWKWTWADKTLVSVFMIILCLFGVSSIIQLRSAQDTNQKVKWLLEKANREDCLSGVKNPESPECS